MKSRQLWGPPAATGVAARAGIELGALDDDAGPLLTRAVGEDRDHRGAVGGAFDAPEAAERCEQAGGAPGGD